jgi:hypothetical protein
MNQKNDELVFYKDVFSGIFRLERETGFEPATLTLARLHSTTELFPHRAPLYMQEIVPCQDSLRFFEKNWTGTGL